jgi:hypothetical protein
MKRDFLIVQKLNDILAILLDMSQRLEALETTIESTTHARDASFDSQANSASR